MPFLEAIKKSNPVVEVIENKATKPGKAFPEGHPLTRKNVLKAQKTIQALPAYKETPLVSLGKGANAGHIADLYYKDESRRFNLGSFKSLGGAYAVLKLANRPGTKTLTICSATAGNHGRSVSFGAKMAGIKCVIFIGESVSEGRAKAMRVLGAEVIGVKGNYEDSLHAATTAARENGWQLVSDTAFPGYEKIPLDIMQGYGVMGEEISRQLPENFGIEAKDLTHVFLQAGCGGFAAALMASILNLTESNRPKFILVEPKNVACVLQSIKAGEMKVIEGNYKTFMGGLAAGEVSLVAWPVLKNFCDFVISIPDDPIGPAMRALRLGELS